MGYNCYQVENGKQLMRTLSRCRYSSLVVTVLSSCCQTQSQCCCRHSWVPNRHAMEHCRRCTTGPAACHTGEDWSAQTRRLGPEDSAAQQISIIRVTRLCLASEYFNNHWTNRHTFSTIKQIRRSMRSLRTRWWWHWSYRTASPHQNVCSRFPAALLRMARL
jgi:hypothetical protein